MAIATIVDGDRRRIDLVVVFRYELDVGRKLDRLRRFERLIEFPKQFFLFAVPNCLISAYLFELFFDGRPWVGEHFRLWIDRCHH